MSTPANETTSSGRPTSVPQKNDRYLFGNLDSFAKNQEKVHEVSWGEEQPEGIVLASLDAAIVAQPVDSDALASLTLAEVTADLFGTVGAVIDLPAFFGQALSAPRPTSPSVNTSPKLQRDPRIAHVREIKAFTPKIETAVVIIPRP